MKKGLTLLLAGLLIFAFIETKASAQPIIIKAVTAFPKPNLNNDPVPLLLML